MAPAVLTIWDQEDLHYNAEELLLYLRSHFYWYDAEGDNIFLGLPEEERDAALTEAFRRQEALGDRNYLDIPENHELRKITFFDAMHMPLEEIKEKYLKFFLPKARNMLRKGSPFYFGVVSDEVPDSYLDDLLALRWRENLKLWTIRWDERREKKAGPEKDP